MNKQGDKRMSNDIKISIEEVLELVNFTRDSKGRLRISNVHGDVLGNVGYVLGDVGYVGGDVKGSVLGGVGYVGGDVKGSVLGVYGTVAGKSK